MSADRPKGKRYAWGRNARGAPCLVLVAGAAELCGNELDCGGRCCLAPAHEGEHTCCGDTSEPGTCPA